MLSGATSWTACLKHCLHCCHMLLRPIPPQRLHCCRHRSGPALVAKAAPFLPHLHYTPMYTMASKGSSESVQQHDHTAPKLPNSLPGATAASASHARQLTAALLPCSTVEHPPLFTTTSVASNTCGGRTRGPAAFHNCKGMHQRKCRRRPAGARRQLLLVRVGKARARATQHLQLNAPGFAGSAPARPPARCCREAAGA